VHNKTWVIVTIGLCVVFAVLAFPVFMKARGLPTAIGMTLIGFVVIWFAYYARAWVFTRPGFWQRGAGGGQQRE